MGTSKTQSSPKCLPSHLRQCERWKLDAFWASGHYLQYKWKLDVRKEQSSLTGAGIQLAGLVINLAARSGATIAGVFLPLTESQPNGAAFVQWSSAEVKYPSSERTPIPFSSAA